MELFKKTRLKIGKAMLAKKIARTKRKVALFEYKRGKENRNSLGCFKVTGIHFSVKVSSKDVRKEY